MRKLTITTLALATSLAFAGAALADEGTTRENAETAAVAAQSWQNAHQQPTAALGYRAQGSERAQQIETIFTQPSHQTSGDAQFIQQGDRGIGNN